MVFSLPSMSGRFLRGARSEKKPGYGGGWRWMALQFLGCVLLCLAVHSHVPAQTSLVVDGARGQGVALVDITGQLTIAEVNERFEAGQGFAANASEFMPTGSGHAIWYRIALPAVTGPARLVVTVPYAGMDRVEFYRPAPNVGWDRELAGDSIAVDDWPVRNLYPTFRFELQPGEERATYLRVQHFQPISIHWRIWDSGSFFENAKVWHMVLGAYAGLVMLVVLQAAFRAVSWRDPIDVGFAAHVLVAALAQLALTGVAGEYLWPAQPRWNDLAPSVLSVVGLGLLHFFIRQLVVERGERWLSHGLLAMSLAGLVIGLGFVVGGRPVFGVFSSPYILLSFVLLLAVAAWYAWHHAAVGLWVLGAVLALTVGGIFPVLRNLQLQPMTFATQYGAQIGVAAEVGMLLVALHYRNRQRRDNQTRVGALGRVDPLTGVANHKVLMHRLEQLLARQRRDPGLGAVMRVRVSNAVDIRQEWGMETAQNAVVHAGACITGVAREGDIVARHRDGDFVLILGGHIKRDELSDLGQRLIARGLGESHSLPASTALQLKIAIAEAPLRAADATLLLQSLGNVLAELTARPGKALRFIA